VYHSFKSIASEDPQAGLIDVEDNSDERRRARSSPAESYNLVSHMVSSSSSSSSLGRKQAAILANFAQGRKHLEWACAKNYARFASERRREFSPEAPASEKGRSCDCCANLCECSDSEDEPHEAITPGSETVPLPVTGGRIVSLRPIEFRGPLSAFSKSKLCDRDFEAAQALLDLACGP
jgi:hypothetical protein